MEAIGAFLACADMEPRLGLKPLGSALVAIGFRDKGKVALEGYKNHGLFTGVLLEGLLGGADYTKDEHIDISELETYLSNQVPKVSKKRFGVESFPMVDKQGQSFPIAIPK